MDEFAWNVKNILIIYIYCVDAICVERKEIDPFNICPGGICGVFFLLSE